MYSLLLASVILLAAGLAPSLHRLYSPDVILRRQTDRLLSGRESISSSAADVAWDLAWGRGNVQQVWGLGVPVWRLPFEALAKILGYPGFPDRVPFGFALSIVIYTIIRFQRRCASEFQSPKEITIVWGFLPTVLFVPFLTLCNSRFSVYEEVCAHGYLIGLLLMVWTVWLSSGRVQTPALLALAFISGLVPFVRPTLGSYGLASLAVACIAVYRKDKRLCLRLLPVLVMLFLLASGLLLYSNSVRFGSCFEFGYSLNTNNLSAMAYASRFQSPFGQEPLVSAVRELFGLLFRSYSIVGAAVHTNAIPGQSATFRWREIYFSTYDMSVFVMIGIVWAWLGWRLYCGFKGRGRFANMIFLETAALWSVIGALPLAVFYLRFPFISSRYLLDFAPSFAAAAWVLFWLIHKTVAWLTRSATYASLLAALLASGWWVCEVATTKNYTSPLETDRAWAWRQVAAKMKPPNGRLPRKPVPEYYTNGYQFLRIPFNGTGWSSTGNTEACVSLFVQNPDSLILEVAPADEERLAMSDYDCIQAKIGLEFLKRESITPTTDGVRIFFSGPKRKLYQKGIQLASLGMMSPQELNIGYSKFRLLKVAWHRNRVQENTQ